MRKNAIFNLCLAALVFMALPLGAQEQKLPPLKMEKVSGNVYCLYGPGGNMGILKTDDGFLVVDSLFEETAPDVLKLIATLSDKPIKYLVNTHYHGDHTNGNAALAKTATVIMHPACKASLLASLKQKESTKEPPYTIKTWTKDMVVTLGDENVMFLHFGNGHSAGDLVVVFEKDKVLHTGDLFFHGMPPYIDVADGSDTENWIRTIETICKEYPDYKIIPGHGDVTDPGQYIKMAEYLKYLRKEVAAAIQAGKTREQTVASVNLEPYKDLPDMDEWCNKKGNVGWIYDEMTRKK